MVQLITLVPSAKLYNHIYTYSPLKRDRGTMCENTATNSLQAGNTILVD